MTKLCEYGCGREAKYVISTGKWCCSERYQKCPAVLKRIEDRVKTNSLIPEEYKVIIKHLWYNRYTLKEIKKEIGFNSAVISREIKLNNFEQGPKYCIHCYSYDNLKIHNGNTFMICRDCEKVRRRKSMVGKQICNPDPNIERKCKYCGTTKYKDFIRNSGKVGVTSCSKCQYKKTSYWQSDVLGGRVNGPLSKEHIQKLVESHKGLIQSTESIEKIRKALKGRKQSKEHRENCRQARLGTKLSYETKLKKSEKLKRRKKDYEELFPFFCKMENIRDCKEPTGLQMAGIEVKCKNCNKWFTPTQDKVWNRVWSLEKSDGVGNYFYCSDNCKDNCPLFGLRTDTILNLIKDPKELPYTSEEYQTFRQEVLKRQYDELGYNECEICGQRTNLHIHHEKPQKTHSNLSLDPDNGIILCKDCHYKKGHIEECSTGNLAKMVCA